MTLRGTEQSRCSFTQLAPPTITSAPSEAEEAEHHNYSYDMESGFGWIKASAECAIVLFMMSGEGSFALADLLQLIKLIKHGPDKRPRSACSTDNLQLISLMAGVAYTCKCDSGGERTFSLVASSACIE